MNRKHLIIHSMIIHRQDAPSAEYKLSDITVLPREISPILPTAYQAIVGNRNAAAKLWQGGISLVSTVSIGSNLFRVSVADGQIQVSTRQDCTQKYLKTLRHTQEEMDLLCFDPPQTYPIRLSQYKLGRLFALRKAKPVGYTATFRAQVKRFVREFQPEQLVPGKDYWLRMARNGSFYVSHGSKKNPTLSESEQTIYHYLCYLHLLRFWNQMLALYSLDGPILPVIIPHVLSRIDASIDQTQLMDRCRSLDRQVAFLK